MLEQAYQLSRTLSDKSSRSNAACALAAALSGTGDIPRAEALFQEGLQRTSRPAPVSARQDFLSAAWHDGSRATAGPRRRLLPESQAAQRLLQVSPVRSEMLDLRVLMDLAEAYRGAGQFREAIATFEQASARLTSLGRDETETAGTLFNDWALALWQRGRPLEAEPIFRRAISHQPRRPHRPRRLPYVAPELRKDLARRWAVLTRPRITPSAHTARRSRLGSRWSSTNHCCFGL